MTDPVATWLTTNYPGLNIQDATRLRLLELAGPQHAGLSIPELWLIWLASTYNAVDLQNGFSLMYTADSVPPNLQNPLYVIVVLGPKAG